MSTFPALSPQARTYIPGATAITPIAVSTGDEITVRHSNASVGNILRFTFRGLTSTQHSQIINHYNIHGQFQAFDLPTELLAGSDLIFPTGYLWIYATSPQTSYTPGLVDVTVELQLLPPYAL